MARIKVSQKGSAYFSDDLRGDGYVGELEVIADACVLLVRKPGTKLKDAIRSLKILRTDLEHRLEMGQE